MLSQTTAKKKKKRKAKITKEIKLSTDFRLIYNINEIQTNSNRFTKTKHQASRHIVLCVCVCIQLQILYIYTHRHTQA